MKSDAKRGVKEFETERNESARLVTAIRENVPYVRSQGWYHLASLMVAAAAEIERLAAQADVSTRSGLLGAVAPRDRPIEYAPRLPAARPDDAPPP